MVFIDLEPPYDKLTYCKKGDDEGEEYCKEQTDDEFNYCWKLNFVQDDYDGICIPKDVPCESNDDCKAIGGIHSGSVLASCSNNLCEYSRGMVIA